MAIVIAGERSGVGKTTVTLALLAALRSWGESVRSFKVGPDYIDPMFHRQVTGRSCRNLDVFLTSESYVQTCFARHCQTVEYALVEGVMGLFDGAAGTAGVASTAHVARSIEVPVVLVVDCRGVSQSIAALIHGYRTFDARVQIAGVVLNRVGSDRHLEFLKAAIEPLNLPILGVLRREAQIQIPDRHLGLVPTAELPNLREILDRLAHLGQTCFDWQRLKPLLAAPQRSVESRDRLEPIVRLAIAQDPAFSFYYPDNLDLLQQLGAELIPWSPLQDSALPIVDGLYFGGGFPEMFADALSQNRGAIESVRSAIRSRMPTYAECGGLMYLGDRLVDFEGRSFNLVGEIHAATQMRSRLTLGYRTTMARHSTPMLSVGTELHAHEFHRSALVSDPSDPLFALPAPEGFHSPSLHASYLHLHWGETPQLPARFLQHCRAFREAVSK